MPEVSSLMAGKRGLVMGVANERSIAWGIARTAHAHGAELAFTYQGEALEKRVRPLAAQAGSDMVLPCDVTDSASMDDVFGAIGEAWGGLDFVVRDGRSMVQCEPGPGRRRDGDARSCGCRGGHLSDRGPRFP